MPALTETAILMILVAGALWQFDRLDLLDFGSPGNDIFTVLALAAGIAAVAAAMARIGPAPATMPNRRPTVSLAFYAAATISVGVILSTAEWTTIARFAAGGFLISLAATLKPKGSTRWNWLAVSVVVTLVAAVAGAVQPNVNAASTLTHLIMIGGWVTAAGLVIAGALMRRPSTWRICVGLSMVVWAYLDNFTGSGGIHLPDLEFGGLSVLGLLVVLFVLARTLAGEVQAARALERGLAERDHEIRNVLSGLAGVSHLLCTDSDALGRTERTALVLAVDAELDRMRELLGESTADTGEDTLVLPLLTRLVALRRARGEQVGLDADRHLVVSMPAHELAQVMANLLANCDRHAPGARVRVGATAADGLVSIAVTDDGPGLPVGATGEAPYDASAGGSGIGLRLCRRLLEAHRGTLSLQTTAQGCHAEVRLPGSVPRGAEAGLPADLEQEFR